MDEYKVDLAEYTEVAEGISNTMTYITSTTARQHLALLEDLRTPYSADGAQEVPRPYRYGTGNRAYQQTTGTQAITEVHWP